MSVDLPHRLVVESDIAADFTRRLVILPYTYVYLWVTVEALDGTPSAATFDLKVQATDPISDDGPDTYAWVDIPGAAITQITDATSLPSTQVIVLGPEQLCSPHMQLTCDVSFTGGSSPTWATTISWVGRL